MHMPRTYHACTYIPCIYHGAQAHNTYHAYVLCTFVHTTYIPCIYHTSTVHTHLPCLRHGGAYMHISHIYIYIYIYHACATGVHACTTPCASPSIACRGSPARTCHGAALTRLHLLRRHLLGYTYHGGTDSAILTMACRGSPRCSTSCLPRSARCGGARCAATR